jgi:hypothetical protein
MEYESEIYQLKVEIIDSLQDQGFRVLGNKILPPKDSCKDSLRHLHKKAVSHRIHAANPRLKKKENELLRYIANGNEVDPKIISPRLYEVKRNSEFELLFRYVSLHWSIPVSCGYGRRLRFVVIDENNGKLMGILGLGDPVFSLAPRDNWIGWNFKTRKEKLKYVMEAFVLGSVPPYSMMLCGKLIAMLVSSQEVINTFTEKYKGRISFIRKKNSDAKLALITTASALGRSSLYNRIKFNDRKLYNSVGYSGGWGDFHFANGLYDKIFKFSTKYCQPTAKKKDWGKGFRNRREVVRKCLSKLNLSDEYLNHGVARELFLVPLAENTIQFLKGETNELRQYKQSIEELYEYFKKRWLVPRVSRDARYEKFCNSQYVLWKDMVD